MAAIMAQAGQKPTVESEGGMVIATAPPVVARRQREDPRLRQGAR